MINYVKNAIFVYSQIEKFATKMKTKVLNQCSQMIVKICSWRKTLKNYVSRYLISKIKGFHSNQQIKLPLINLFNIFVLLNKDISEQFCYQTRVNLSGVNKYKKQDPGSTVAPSLNFFISILLLFLFTRREGLTQKFY